MLIKRNAEDIIKEALDKISQNTPITNFHAGAIARSITEALAGEYESLYDFAEDVLNMGFLSRADEAHLSLIGELFNYPRRTVSVIGDDGHSFTNELIDVETYRYELSNRVHTAVAGNYESLRLACLSVPGVQSIHGKEYTHGTGSFSFVITPLNGFDEEVIMSDVETAIAKVKSYGVKPTVILPINVPIELKIQLSFHESTTLTEKERVRLEVRNALHDYFGNFIMGQGFIYNDLVQETMNVNKNVVDFKIISFYLNNEPSLLTNQPVLEDERIRPRVIDVL